jgi:hypothetical protein
MVTPAQAYGRTYIRWCERAYRQIIRGASPVKFLQYLSGDIRVEHRNYILALTKCTSILFLITSQVNKYRPKVCIIIKISSYSRYSSRYISDYRRFTWSIYYTYAYYTSRFTRQLLAVSFGRHSRGTPQLYNSPYQIHDDINMHLYSVF